MHAFYFRKKLCEIKVNAIFLIQIAEKRFWGQEEILEEILQEILEILGTQYHFQNSKARILEARRNQEREKRQGRGVSVQAARRAAAGLRFWRM